MNADLYSTLVACEEYFEQRADAEIDASGTTGNEEMRLLMDVREALASVPKPRLKQEEPADV